MKQCKGQDHSTVEHTDCFWKKLKTWLWGIIILIALFSTFRCMIFYSLWINYITHLFGRQKPALIIFLPCTTSLVSIETLLVQFLSSIMMSPDRNPLLPLIKIYFLTQLSQFWNENKIL